MQFEGVGRVFKGYFEGLHGCHMYHGCYNKVKSALRDGFKNRKYNNNNIIIIGWVSNDPVFH